MAEVPVAPEDTFGRDTEHYDRDAFWRSTGLRIWNLVMEPSGYRFDLIELADLIAEHSHHLMTEFVSRCGTNPPVSLHAKVPYGVSSLQNCIVHACRKLKERFITVIPDNHPDIFPDESIAAWKKTVKNHSNHILMEGEDESALLKDTFPIPRVYNERTVLFPLRDFQDQGRRIESRKVDMKHLGQKLFGQERITDLLKLCFTFSGIGRSGEVKFLTYNTFSSVLHTAFFLLSGSRGKK